MKLLAYKINGKTVNIDVFNWNYSELNGNQPWIVSSTDIYGYADITSIENWDGLSMQLNKDFLFIRQQIKQLLDVSYVDKSGNTITYSDYMNHNEGVIESRYFLVDKSKRDIYISEAEQLFWWNVLIEKSLESRKIRFEQAKKYISYKLTSENSSDLAISTYELGIKYVDFDITGKVRDGYSGLFDYLKGVEDFSTNGYPSKSYWSQQDQDRILDILENGNY
jgi:hypothetical protein